jgi:hypothetical protein
MVAVYMVDPTVFFVWKLAEFWGKVKRQSQGVVKQPFCGHLERRLPDGLNRTNRLPSLQIRPDCP